MSLPTFRFTCFQRIRTALAVLLFSLVPLVARAQFPGGFLEQPLALSTVLEPVLGLTQIQNFLPQRGKFTFPAPYNTQAIRLTNAADCGGTDCVDAVGYSYWRNINNHVGQDSMLIMVGLDRTRGGAGLTLLQYNKLTDALTNLGPVFDSNSPYGWGSGEGWYFSATLPTKIYLNTGPTILRYDVISKQFETIFDVTTKMGGGYLLHQIHSSNDDRVHSATVRNASSLEMLGCMTYATDTAVFHYYPAIGDFDECQIDKSGQWLVIKENVDGLDGEDNVIINLATGNQRILLDRDGAGGHSDLGYGYMVAADNWASQSNTQRVWDFSKNPLVGTIVYANNDWNSFSPSHVSHANSKAAVAINQQFACGSSANRYNTAEANEILCFKLDGSRNTLVVAPVMSSLDSRSGGDYDNSPKGNLDVTGQYFIWTSNMGGARLDAFLVKIPSQLLGVAGGTPPPAPVADTTAPSVTLGAPAANATVSGTVTVSASASDNVGVAGVQFLLDNGNLGSEDASAPYSVAWNTAGLSGSHTLRVIARDAAGNSTTSAAITVSIQSATADTTAPLISAISAGSVTSNTAQINWSTSEPAQDRVEYGISTAYGSATAISTTLAAAHAVSLGSLNAGTLYHYRVLSRDAAGNIATSGDYTLTTAAQAAAGGTQPSAVAWIDRVNVTATGDTLKKTVGCDGCADAGAASQQQIGNSGYLEFTATVESGLRYVGLSHTNNDTSANDLDFGLRLQGNAAEIRENGTYRGDLAFSAGDVFRISVASNKVTYARNGAVFYTSTITPAALLRADTSFASVNSTISKAVIVISSPGSSTSIPVGQWQLDAGSLATDTSGNGYHGNLIGGPLWTGGVVGNALALDGINDYVEIPHNAALNSYPLSISLWVKTGATGLQALVNKYALGSLNGYQVFVNNGNLCAVYFRDASNYVSNGGNCPLSIAGVADNRWHHVGFTVDASGGTLYMDGVATARQAWTGTPGATTTTRPLTLGAYPGAATSYLAGTLDDVRIYSRSATAAEVAAYYASVPQPATGGAQPVAWTGLVNVTASAGAVQKTSGCDGCADAGAASTAQILSGSGYVEFTASVENRLRVIGLSGINSTTSDADIRYGLRLQGGVAEVREAGVYRSDLNFAAGDVFRIAVDKGRVSYARNGVVFYTSSLAPVYPLRTDTTFNSSNASLKDVVMRTTP